MNGKEMATALGISEAMVSKLRKRGMPMTTAEAAERWRKRHLEPARMKGTRVDTAPQTPAKRAAPQASTLVEALLAVAPRFDVPIPAETAQQMRQILRQMSFDEFQRVYDAAWGGELVWRLAPDTVGQWDNWEPEGLDDDEEWFEPIADAELPLLHLVVAGVLEFVFDPAAVPASGPRPAFRDCVRLAGAEKERL